jgi:hypothetical protein
MANILRRSWLIPRRTALKGLGAALLLPLLDQMGWAESPRAARRAPTRLAYIYVPYGVLRQQKALRPTTEGPLSADANLPAILAPLRPVLDAVTVISGLDNDQKGNFGHGVEVCNFLANQPVKKGEVYANRTVDQFAAAAIGTQTPIPSLELCVQDGFVDGKNKDYPGTYHTQLSWYGPTTPADHELRPRAILERLFAAGRCGKATTGRATTDPTTDDSPRTTSTKKSTSRGTPLTASMLDLVLDDQKRLVRELGHGDRQKIDEYLTSLRSVERTIQRNEQTEREAGAGRGPASFARSPLINVEIPAGSQDTLDPNYIYNKNVLPFSTRARVMLDLLTLAFQSDSTRIATLLFSYPYGASYPELGFSENHHGLSHHENNADKMEKFLKVNVLQAEQFAYVLGRMRALHEGDGTLLDNTMLVYGSGMGDGSAHDSVDLPILLGGRGGGTIRSGRHLPAPKQRLANLHLALVNRLGVKAESWGDSTRALDLG